MYFLDTDTLSLLWKNHEKVVERVRLVGSSVPLAITVVTVMELFQGRFSAIIKAADGPELVRAAERLDETTNRLNSLRVADIEERAADVFGRLRQNKKIKKIGRPDILIACIVLAHDATLVTRNVNKL